MALTVSILFANAHDTVLIEEVDKVVVRKGIPADGVYATNILEVLIQHQDADVYATTIDGQHVLMVQVTVEGSDEDLNTESSRGITTYTHQPTAARPQDSR